LFADGAMVTASGKQKNVYSISCYKDKI
jgi:hypothetical protein